MIKARVLWRPRLALFSSGCSTKCLFAFFGRHWRNGRGLAQQDHVPQSGFPPQKQERKAARFRQGVEWLFSPEHFHLKLFVATAVGVFVIVLLAVSCFVLTYR